MKLHRRYKTKNWRCVPVPNGAMAVINDQDRIMAYNREFKTGIDPFAIEWDFVRKSCEFLPKGS
jgi:hypothetical protein